MKFHKILIPSIVSITLLLGSACSKKDKDKEKKDNAVKAAALLSIKSVPLTIEKVSPLNNSKDTPVDPMLTIKFNKNLDVDSITQDNFSIKDINGNKVENVVMSYNKKTVTIYTNLEENKGYNLTISDRVTGDDGIALGGSPSVTNFTTGNKLRNGTVVKKLDYDPYGKKVVYARKIENIMVLGEQPSSTDTNLQFMLNGIDEASPTTFTTLNREASTVLNSTRKKAVSANLDSDTFEELVYLSWNSASGGASIYVVDRNSSPTSDTDVSKSTDILSGRKLIIDSASTDKYYFDLAAGDVDDDGKDEILVAATDLTTQKTRIYVFDDSDKKYAQLLTYSITDAVGIAKIRSKNANNIEGDEVLVAYSTGTDLKYLVFEKFFSENKSTLKSGTLTGFVSNASDDDGDRFDIAMGNVDDDARNEFVFASITGTNQYKFLVMDDGAGKTNGGNFSTILKDKVNEHTYTSTLATTPKSITVRIADTDGDKNGEILINEAIFEDSTNGTSWNTAKYLLPNFSTIASISSKDTSITTANIRGSGLKHDVMVLYKDADTKPHLKLYSQNSAGTGMEEKNNLTFDSWKDYPLVTNLDFTNALSSILKNPGSPLATFSSLKNTRDDKARATFNQSTNETKTNAFTDIKILAVLNQAPCKESGNYPDIPSIGQTNNNSCETLMKVENSKEQGFGFTISNGGETAYSVKLGVELGPVNLSASIERTNNFQLELAKEESRNVTYATTDSAGIGEDLVLYYTTPSTMITKEIVDWTIEANDKSIICLWGICSSSAPSDAEIRTAINNAINKNPSTTQVPLTNSAGKNFIALKQPTKTETTVIPTSAPILLASTIPFYNANRGKYANAPEINPTEIFGKDASEAELDKKGKLTGKRRKISDRYPDAKMMNAYLKKYAGDYEGIKGVAQSLGPAAVTQGTGFRALGITVDTSSSTSLTNTIELSTKVSVEASLFGSGGAYSGGVTSGQSKGDTVTIGKGISFEGQVGGINAENYSNNYYSWGIFSYMFTKNIKDTSTLGSLVGAEKQLSFFVVNFWVEDDVEAQQAKTAAQSTSSKPTISGLSCENSNGGMEKRNDLGYRSQNTDIGGISQETGLDKAKVIIYGTGFVTDDIGKNKVFLKHSDGSADEEIKVTDVSSDGKSITLEINRSQVRVVGDQLFVSTYGVSSNGADIFYRPRYLKASDRYISKSLPNPFKSFTYAPFEKNTFSSDNVSTGKAYTRLSYESSNSFAILTGTYPLVTCSGDTISRNCSDESRPFFVAGDNSDNNSGFFRGGWQTDQNGKYRWKFKILSNGKLGIQRNSPEKCIASLYYDGLGDNMQFRMVDCNKDPNTTNGSGPGVFEASFLIDYLGTPMEAKEK